MSKTKPRVFCSDKCRKVYNRKLEEGKITDKKITDTEKTDNIEKITDTTQKLGQCRYCGKIATPEEFGDNYNLIECCYECSEKRRKGELEYKPITRDVKKADAEMLYGYIGAYEQDTWKDSPEFKELTERLKKPVKWLRANGYWVPNRLEKVKL